MTREEYEKRTAATRRARIAWWEEAKFGLFIHYGIYSAYGRGEWIKLREGISREEYLRTAEEKMTYKTGTAEEWVRCAADAGMRYAILTTQHHDGFSLWDKQKRSGDCHSFSVASVRMLSFFRSVDDFQAAPHPR